MTPKSYLESLINGQEISSIPVQLSELKTLLALMETQDTVSRGSWDAYIASDKRRQMAIENRKNLTDADHTVWKDLCDSDKIVNAIKYFRDLTGCGLKEAKDTIDWWRANRTVKYFF